MNPRMWTAKATQRNLAQLVADGVRIVGPNAGEMAERGEAGLGRMAEPAEIATAAEAMLRPAGPLSGKRVLVTSGPTHEPIDPVRFIANRSSGKQGHAIAAAAAAAGADVVLVSGPVEVPGSAGSCRRESRDRASRCLRRSRRRCRPTSPSSPPRSPIGGSTGRAAARSKNRKAAPQQLALVENPDILATVAHRKSGRPTLVIGFAAETDNVDRQCQEQARKKGL